MESGKRNKEKSIDGKLASQWSDVVASLSVPEGRGKENVWSAILAKVENKDASVISLNNSWKRWMGIAATLVLLFTFYFMFMQNELTIIETGKGQQSSFFLPDGSKVTLNADSRVSYKADAWKNERLVNLDGEAFFEVEKGKKFAVQSSNGNVEVLGTSFNIFARNNNYRVDCFTGKVKVSNKDYDKYAILTPGLSTSIKNNQLQSIVKNNMELKGYWLSGEFHFEEAKLSEVFEELERQFNIKVDADQEIYKRLYTGYFSNKDNIDQSLELICSPMGLQFEKRNDSIYITE
jgi:ferric-dicitrate binding protein FerR (iron transport regulator)